MKKPKPAWADDWLAAFEQRILWPALKLAAVGLALWMLAVFSNLNFIR